MKNYIIKLCGGYTADEYNSIAWELKNQMYHISDKIYMERKAYKNFFLDTIQGKNRDEHGKFCTRDSLKEYFAWCHIYGQMPHKKLTNAFMDYERSLSKVKSVKRTSEA